MKNEPYLVSILVPVYGVEKYIERCAISLFEQTYSNIEFIFVNDNTKDASIDILKNVLENYPERRDSVRIISHDHNMGLGETRNTAVLAAHGDFVMHVDSDDWIEKNSVELCVKTQLDSHADLVLMDLVQLHKSWKLVCHAPKCKTGRELVIAMLTWKSVWNVWGMLIRRELYINHGIKVEKGVNMSEDLQVSPRLAYYSQKVAQVGIVLYNYDCTRENQYTHIFSIDNHQQTLKTLDILTVFFKTNDSVLLEYMYTMKANLIANNIKNISKTKGEDFDNYYNNVLLGQLDLVPRKYWKYVGMPERIMFYLRYRRVNQLYVYLAGIIKHHYFSESL